MEKRWMTEFANLDDEGAIYSGPLVLADGLEMAEALLCCVRGPNGEMLRIVGELIKNVPNLNDGSRMVIVRPVNEES